MRPPDDLVPSRTPGPHPSDRRRIRLLGLAAAGAAVVVLAAVVAIVASDGNGDEHGTVGAGDASTTAPPGATADAPSSAATASPSTGSDAAAPTSRPTGATPGPTTAPAPATSAPVATVPPVTPPPTPPGGPPGTVSSAERDAAIGDLVAQGLTGAEATCVVDRVTATFGDPSLVSDPEAPPAVQDGIFDVTQECLFGTSS